jgi:hypothetical protein
MNTFFEYNDDVCYDMIDPEEHKAWFIKYCTDPAVQEEELYPYDDFTYPIPVMEDE